MTEIGGYRTLAQLGVVRPPAPESPQPPRASAPINGPVITPQPSPLVAPTPSTQPRADGTALDTIRDGIDLVREWHPRDPGVRLEGRYERTEDSLPSPTDVIRGRVTHTDPDARSETARIAMLVGLAGGFAQNGIDVMRLIKKYPEALRASRFDPSLGPLGRLPTALGLTALTRPDNRILDPRVKGLAASIETGGRTFDRFDELAMKTSVLLGASLAALQIGAAIPNLKDALDNEGPWYENLAMSTSGRAGVLQLAGGGLGAAVFGAALRQTANQAGSGVVAKVLAAGSAPIMARPIWGRIGLASGAIVAANELGFFDRFNRGETRSAGETLSDATHRTPVLNDAEWRTGALLGAAGVTAFKVHRAASTGGGMAALGKGHVIGSAVVAGLLGAQLLGGLGALDKPADQK